MALPLYLAMTAVEMRTRTVYPDYFAYMACHFSPYGTGISNLPGALPENAMLILNDRIPWNGHNPERIIRQLSDTVLEQKCESVLLDFQRPNVDGFSCLIHMLTEKLPCPVGVSSLYAADFSCPVFLPPVPLDTPLKAYIAPWKGREIWLEAALDGCTVTVTAQGSQAAPLPYPKLTDGHANAALHCHYQIESEEYHASFTLFRTKEDLNALLGKAQSLGITRAIGLWQELYKT